MYVTCRQGVVLSCKKNVTTCRHRIKKRFSKTMGLYQSKEVTRWAATNPFFCFLITINRFGSHVEIQIRMTGPRYLKIQFITYIHLLTVTNSHFMKVTVLCFAFRPFSSAAIPQFINYTSQTNR